MGPVATASGPNTWGNWGPSHPHPDLRGRLAQPRSRPSQARVHFTPLGRADLNAFHKRKQISNTGPPARSRGVKCTPLDDPPPFLYEELHKLVGPPVRLLPLNVRPRFFTPLERDVLVP